MSDEQLFCGCGQMKGHAGWLLCLDKGLNVRGLPASKLPAVSTEMTIGSGNVFTDLGFPPDEATVLDKQAREFAKPTQQERPGLLGGDDIDLNQPLYGGREMDAYVDVLEAKLSTALEMLREYRTNQLIRGHAYCNCGSAGRFSGPRIDNRCQICTRLDESGLLAESKEINK